MTVFPGVARRALIAVAIGAIALGSGIYLSGPAGSTPRQAAALATTTTTSAPTTTTTTTTTAPAPEPEPVTEPAPPPPPRPAPKPKPAAAPAPPAADTSGQAAQLISLINRYRSANGVAPLAQASDAMAKAQQHSNDMAAQGRIFHSSSLSSGIRSGWTAIGENVGMGGSVSQVESMFEASSPHRANLLNSGYNQIGVGVAYGSDGQIYVTETFVGR